MKALVTGASGFVGSTLIEHLGKSGIQVQALLRKTSEVSNLKGLRYERVEGDLSNPESLREAVRGMDYVFHVAGATAASNRSAFFRHNAEGSRLVAQAVAEVNPGLKRMVYVSSLAAAGPAQAERPRVESDENRPVSDYGASKLQAEIEVLKFKDRFPITIVRPPMVFGPKDKGVYVVMQTVAKRVMPLLRGATPTGDKFYSSVHVSDLCRGIVLAGLAPVEKITSGEIFYVASDQIHTYGELLQAMAETLALRPLRFPVPKFAISGAAYGMAALGAITGKTYPLNLDKLNEILPDYWTCSNSKARNVLGFVPQFDLKAGIADAIAWYKREGWL